MLIKKIFSFCVINVVYNLENLKLDVIILIKY